MLAPPPDDIGAIRDATSGFADGFAILFFILVGEVAFPIWARWPADGSSAEKVADEGRLRALEGDWGAIGVAASGIWPR